MSPYGRNAEQRSSNSPSPGLICIEQSRAALQGNSHELRVYREKPISGVISSLILCRELNRFIPAIRQMPDVIPAARIGNMAISREKLGIKMITRKGFNQLGFKTVCDDTEG